MNKKIKTSFMSSYITVREFVKNNLPILLVFLLSLHSCIDYEKEEPAGVLMKTPVLTLSISEFLEELELKKVSYPYAITKNSADYNEMIIELVNTLSEELVLLSVAQSRGIDISEEELKVKADELSDGYTKEQFAEILLEKAIPLKLWQKRLKKNMIMEKLVETEVKNKLEIAPEEIVKFYKDYNKENNINIQDKKKQDNSQKKKNKKKQKNKNTGDDKDEEDKQDNIIKRKELKDEQELIVLLRLQKTQKIYEEWIKELEQEFPVEINKEKLKMLFRDKNRGKDYEN